MHESIIIVGDDGILTRQAVEIAGLLGYENIQVVTQIKPDTECLFVATSDSLARARLITSLDSKRLTNLIHPTAFVSPQAILARNIIVGAQAVVGSKAQVANGVVLNALSSIEHDDRIGPHTFIGTGAILCGNVTTGEFVFIGGGATVKPGTTIGAHTTIGTGSVVVKDATGNSTYVGNPARLIT